MLGTQSAWRPRNYSEVTAAAIDRTVKDIVAKAFETARTVLQSNRKLLESGGADLLAHETLVHADLERYAKQIVSPTKEVAIAAQ